MQKIGSVSHRATAWMLRRSDVHRIGLELGLTQKLVALHEVLEHDHREADRTSHLDTQTPDSPVRFKKIENPTAYIGWNIIINQTIKQSNNQTIKQSNNQTSHITHLTRFMDLQTWLITSIPALRRRSA